MYDIQMLEWALPFIKVNSFLVSCWRLGSSYSLKHFVVNLMHWQQTSFILLLWLNVEFTNILLVSIFLSDRRPIGKRHATSETDMSGGDWYASSVTDMPHQRPIGFMFTHIFQYILFMYIYGFTKIYFFWRDTRDHYAWSETIKERQYVWSETL